MLTRPLIAGYLGPGDPTGVKGPVLTDFTLVHGAGYIVLLKTKGLRCDDVLSRQCPLGDIVMELFMIGDEASAHYNVLGCNEETHASGATEDQVAKFAGEFGGKVLAGEAHERFQQLITGGRLYTQQFREQEAMLEGSLHWSPVERPGQSKEDPAQLIKYVPDYYHAKFDSSGHEIIEAAGYWDRNWERDWEHMEHPALGTAAIVGVGIWRYTPVGAIVTSLWD